MRKFAQVMSVIAAALLAVSVVSFVLVASDAVDYCDECASGEGTELGYWVFLSAYVALLLGFLVGGIASAGWIIHRRRQP
jgi:hypothetical protein